MPRKKYNPLETKYGQRRLCVHPRCGQYADHIHHITYAPVATAPLCIQHHKDITAININTWERVSHKLKYAERMNAWGKWLMDEIEPDYNSNVERWLATWDEYEAKKKAEAA